MLAHVFIKKRKFESHCLPPHDFHPCAELIEKLYATHAGFVCLLLATTPLMVSVADWVYVTFFCVFINQVSYFIVFAFLVLLTARPDTNGGF